MQLLYEAIEKLQELDKQLTESQLLESNDYDEKAVKWLVNSGLYDQETSRKIVDGLMKEDIHAFIHCDNWLLKYIKGIIRMLIDYADGNKNKALRFLEECPSVFEQYLTYAKEARLNLTTDKEKLAFDTKFNQNMSYEDVKKELEEIQSKLDAESKDKLSKMSFDNSSNYELIPIDSYEQLHNTFGGAWTGDQTSDKGAGYGGTAWCHTNGEYTYNSWINGGNKKFFILAKKGWKHIFFRTKSNSHNPKDNYGTSLIALLVDVRTGKLEKATLRCNHVGVASNADNQYSTYAELSELAGFNVEEQIRKNLPEAKDWSKEIYYWDGKGIVPENVVNVVIKDGVKFIPPGSFYAHFGLRHVNIPNSVTSIGEYAFMDCSSLTNIEIPNGVISIGRDAFSGCRSLTSIEIPNGVTSIGRDVFSGCSSLTSIEIPNSVTIIKDRAFMGCRSLTSIDIPSSVTSIGDVAFFDCSNLKTIICYKRAIADQLKQEYPDKEIILR